MLEGERKEDNTSRTTELSAEKSLQLARSGETAEIRSAIPQGTLVEQVAYHKFKNIEPLFEREGEQKEFAVYYSREIGIKTDEGIFIDILDPGIIPRKKLKGVYFIRSEFNNIESGFEQIPIAEKNNLRTVGWLIRYGEFKKPGDILAL